MEEFTKRFETTSLTTGEIYEIIFESDGKRVKAQCSCPAGKSKTLCKHVLNCIDSDAELRYALTQCGYQQIYEEHELLMKEIESLKKEARNVKKKFERLLLK